VDVTRTAVIQTLVTMRAGKTGKGDKKEKNWVVHVASLGEKFISVL